MSFSAAAKSWVTLLSALDNMSVVAFSARMNFMNAKKKASTNVRFRTKNSRSVPYRTHFSSRRTRAYSPLDPVHQSSLGRERPLLLPAVGFFRPSKGARDAHPRARAAPVPNALIAALPARDRAIVQKYSEPVELALGDVLCEPGSPITHVYFPV